MYRPILVTALWIALTIPGLTQEVRMEPGPKSPEVSLKCIKVRPGFKVELMLAEPLVQDPIAFAWGPDGKFWVVEMGDYPLGLDGKNKPGGRIKYFEKSKPDGPYDKMTLFLDNLGYPTGVFPFGDGVLVTCAPDIFQVKISKGGKAGEKTVLFTGFKEGNQQHRVNGLSWGIDNWIYGANGDSGGVITSLKTGKEVDIRGRDFRFKVETGEFEAVSGQSQFGRCQDDWGNWFGNNNSNPMFHFALDDAYLKRNPHVLYPDPRVQVIPGPIRVYPTSRPLPRFNTPTALNHFTSACSTIIYRDNLFGPAFEGNAFISEPVHNLVHRAIVKPKGVTFSAERAKDEETSEFLASSDNWFRPAMIQVGPDGALWIADMYRYVIEHPEWIPKDWQKKLDLRAGHDKGRIYRVYPADKKPRAIPQMAKMEPAELIKQLESPSGWVRDMAHRRLRAKIDTDDAEAVAIAKRIHEMSKTTPVPQARLHVLWINYLSRAWGYWSSESIERFVKDSHPGVRKHALRIALHDSGAESKLIATHLAAAEKDQDAKIRMQLACSLLAHTSETASKRFVRLLRDNADDRYIVAAGLSSISSESWKPILSELLAQENIPNTLYAPMLRMAKVYGTPLDSSRLFVRQLTSQEKLPMNQQLAAVAELLEVMEKNDWTLKTLLENAAANESEQTLARLKDIHGHAVKRAREPNMPASERLATIRLLAMGLGDDRADHKILLAHLTPQTPDNVQAAVITQLTRKFDPRTPGIVLSPWKSYSPALRGQVLDALLSQPIWTKMTLDAIKRKDIPAQEIDAIRRQRFLLHKDDEIRISAKNVFAAASSSDRGKVVNDYWLRLPNKVDAGRGAKLFVKACAACHKLGDLGQNVGPDLASVGDKSVQGLLTAILDPNRAVEARYVNYFATTKKGQTFSGILTGETSTSITLTANDGKQHQLLRNELDDLSSTGKSMMPDGIEKDLSPQDLADIIEHVRTNLPTPKRKEFPGNQPKIIVPIDGRLRLSPLNAAIYGPSIVIEKKYGNLGYWTQREDHVIWTVELLRETTFSVWLDYACSPDSAGNTIMIQCGDENGQKITHTVKSTGSWDAYQLQSVGTLRLPRDRSQIVIRSEGPIRGALIDLKAVELRPR